MSDNKKIRWGILSTGHIAGRFAEAVQVVPDAELAAVGSRTKASAEAFANEYGIETAHNSYEDLAADPTLDVIYIGSPHAFHLDHAALCMRAGKAVLCEKALTINASEAEEMVRIAREKGVFLMEAMIPRHVPLLKQVMGWIDDGRIGDVRMVKATRCARGEYDPKGRHMNLELGGGSLLDVGVYVVSFAYQVFRETPIEAVGLAHLGPLGSDEQGMALLKYEDGALANLTFALYTETVNEAYIYGTKGYIKIDETFAVPHTARLFIDKEEIEVLSEPIRNNNALIYEAEEVTRCLREGLLESPHMPLDESIEIMRTLDTLRVPWELHYKNDRGRLNNGHH